MGEEDRERGACPLSIRPSPKSSVMTALSLQDTYKLVGQGQVSGHPNPCLELALLQLSEDTESKCMSVDFLV